MARVGGSVYKLLPINRAKLPLNALSRSGASSRKKSGEEEEARKASWPALRFIAAWRRFARKPVGEETRCYTWQLQPHEEKYLIKK